MGAQIHQRGVGANMPFYATALVLDYETEARPFSENVAGSLIAAAAQLLNEIAADLADR
jgi:hypothetical protein